MERPKRPYSLFKRPAIRFRYIYYCRFRGEDGRYLAPVSTGQSNKAAASNWADEEIKRGHHIQPGKRGTLFDVFVSGFWSFSGEYITRQLARGGHFSRRLAEMRAAQLGKWILPSFKGKPLGGIRRHEIESWVMNLYRNSGLTPSTVNRCLTNLKILMAEATRRGFCAADPAAGIAMLAERRKERGVLLPEEIKKLFAVDAVEKVWNREPVFFAAAMLAITGGLRAGEIRALRVMDAHPDFVTVSGSWEEGFGRGGAKWGSERIVPIPSRTANELQAIIKSNPYHDPADLIFVGFKRGVPVGKHVLSDRFNEALERIGVTEALRKDRRLVFHSTRHTFNSIMRGRIDSGKLFRITGHRQESTNIIYTHVLPKDLEEVRAVQEEILSVPQTKSAS
ncbi:MAG: tyrosine-type recombinase/integrase [Spirochaetia bacterium]|jgi:integrase